MIDHRRYVAIKIDDRFLDTQIDIFMHAKLQIYRRMAT